MTPTATRQRPSLRRRLLLLAVALLIAVAGSEIIARVAIAELHEASAAPPAPASEAKLIDLLEPAAATDVIYRLRPNLDCRFLGQEVVTNSHGQRCAQPADSAKTVTTTPSGDLRIIGLGDSVLFGWGVAQADTGLAHLERRLTRRLGSRPPQTINTGVPGHNTAMEVAGFEHELAATATASDIVLLDFVGNDLELPTFLLAETDYWRLDHCFLHDLALRAWRSDWLDPRTALVWTPGTDGHFESDPARAPAEYRHLVGLPAFQRAFLRLVELSRTRGFRLLVTSHHDLPADVAAIVDASGTPRVTIANRIQGWLQANGSPDYLGSKLTLSATDPHPTAMVHGWWAEAVEARLVELQWLPR